MEQIPHRVNHGGQVQREGNGCSEGKAPTPWWFPGEGRHTPFRLAFPEATGHSFCPSGQG